MTRVNRAIELLAQKQPIYPTGPRGRGYEAGREIARTWADYVTYDMEHGTFDVGELREFVRGTVDGGPSPSGHRSVPVVISGPFHGDSEASVRANSWIVGQVLASGVHGLLMVHAEDPAAVRAFVESCRYPFAKSVAGLGDGRRGSGGQAHAAQVWGVETRRYLDVADPWPLNPEGELLLGLKIENKRALEHCEESLAVPGIAFAEWGPGDMGMSLGFPDNHDEPYPAPMLAARNRVRDACLANGVAFYSGVYERDVIERIAEGVMIGGQRDGLPAAEKGRKHTGRTMPW